MRSLNRIINYSYCYYFRTSYILPSMLISLLVVILVFNYSRQKWLAFSMLCIVSAVLSFWTYQKDTVWKDEISMWSDVVEKSPNMAEAHMNLGSAFEANGRADEAKNKYYDAIRIDPDYSLPYHNLGLLSPKEGIDLSVIIHNLYPEFCPAYGGIARRRKPFI